MVRDFLDKKPQIPESVFLAETCAVIGDVVLGERVNVWYGAVIRGDEGSIEIGDDTNVQDNATLHTSPGLAMKIGKSVTVGHNAVVHGCTVGDGTTVGMGAIVLNGAKVGAGCIIGAGALVKEGQEIPDGALCVGVPAKVVRILDEKQRETFIQNAAIYVHLAEEYMR